MNRCAIDSNVAVYAFSEDAKRPNAEAVFDLAPIISVQVLNEFTNVSRRKLKRDWAWIDHAIGTMLLLAERIQPLTLEIHIAARTISERYKLSFYDACVVASALEARADTLFSEDLQDGLRIERLTIRNPFT